jgi:hypothetical protein
MKTVKSIVAIVLVLVITIPCFGGNIHLKRRYKNIGTYSLGLITAISAEYNEMQKTVMVEFFEDYGNVTVSVEDAEGNVIYADAVEAGNGTGIFISLPDISAGNYVLHITPIDGEPMDGDFYVY